MTSGKRGLCVMISNQHFSPESKLNRRAGTEHDTDTLRHVFAQLGFELVIHQDVTAKKAFAAVEEGS